MKSNLSILTVFAAIGILLQGQSSSFVAGQISDEDLIVQAGVLGKIRGSVGTSAPDKGERRTYIQFRGIPYATVPQRFLPSRLLEQPIDNDVFNATAAGLSCFQPLIPDFIMSEDCLSINVYTHKKYSGDDRQLKPVLFFIHGGAFTVGSGASFSGLRLMNRDIVYVSFNYRLGLEGFFSLNNENIPGNAGMYDIVNALKWTHQFIKYFGGNPDLITIAGQSAGSVSVTQLMASPMAQGLFAGAIAASGSALNAWGTTHDPLPESLKIATLCNCYDPLTPPDLASIAYCMRTVAPHTLVKVLYTYQVSERNEGRLGFSVVSPVVQNFPMTSYPKFLPSDPREIFATGKQSKVPLLTGATKHDGSYVLGVVYNRYLKDNGLIEDAEFLRTKMIPTLLLSLGVEDVPRGVHSAITQTYLGDAKNSGNLTEMLPGLMDIFSVFFFKGDCYETAMLHSNIADTYWYSFDYKGSVSLFSNLFPGEDEIPPFPGGVTHSDDLIYLFGLTFKEFSEADATISTKMMDYWADFANSGNPTPREQIWPKLNNLTEKYLIVDEEIKESNYYQDTWIGPGMDIFI